MRLDWIKDEYKTRIRQLVIYFLVFSTIFLLLYMSFPYTFPFILAFIFAWMLQPAMRFLHSRLKFRQGLAAMLLTVILFALIFGLITWMVITLIREATLLIQCIDPDDLSFILVPAERVLEWIKNFFSTFDIDVLQQYESQLIAIVQNSVQIIEAVVRGLLAAVATLPIGLTLIIFVMISTYFLTRDLGKFRISVTDIFSDQFISRSRSVWRTGLVMLAKYIRSYALIYGLTFLQTLIFFIIIRLPYALLLSIIAGIADILPVFGIGFIYWPLAAYLFIDGQTGLGIAVLLAYLVVTVVRQFVEPRLVASSIEIYPVLMLGILYAGLIARSIVLIIYLVLLVMFYKMIKKAGLFDKLQKAVKMTGDEPEDEIYPENENQINAQDQKTFWQTLREKITSACRGRRGKRK